VLGGGNTFSDKHSVHFLISVAAAVGKHGQRAIEVRCLARRRKHDAAGRDRAEHERLDPAGAPSDAVVPEPA
jgi:hypothetical protein